MLTTETVAFVVVAPTEGHRHPRVPRAGRDFLPAKYALLTMAYLTNYLHYPPSGQTQGTLILSSSMFILYFAFDSRSLWRRTSAVVMVTHSNLILANCPHSSCCSHMPSKALLVWRCRSHRKNWRSFTKTRGKELEISFCSQCTFSAKIPTLSKF